jgi:hypothetical protein
MRAPDTAVPLPMVEFQRLLHLAVRVLVTGQLGAVHRRRGGGDHPSHFPEIPSLWNFWAVHRRDLGGEPLAQPPKQPSSGKMWWCHRTGQGGAPPLARWCTLVAGGDQVTYARVRQPSSWSPDTRRRCHRQGRAVPPPTQLFLATTKWSLL